MPATNLYLDLTAHIKPFLGIYAGSQAQGFITYGVPSNNDTVIVSGTTLTKVASNPTGNQFTTIAQLTALICNISGLTATNNGSIITIQAIAAGAAGNAYTLALGVHVGSMTVSGATLTGGLNGDTTKDTILNLLNNFCCQRLDTLLRVSTLARHTVTNELVPGGYDSFECKDFPVLSVASILQGSLQIPYVQTAAYIIKKNVVYLNGYLGGGSTWSQAKYEENLITYDAGYVTYAQNASGTYAGQGITFPDDLLLALLMMLGAVYNQKQNQGVSQYNLHRTQVIFKDSQETEQFEKIINGYKKVFIHGI